MKTNNFINYLKLIGMKILQGINTISMVLCSVTIIYLLWTNIKSFLNDNTIPDMRQIFLFLICVSIVIALNNVDKVLEEKINDFNSIIHRNKELEQHKTNLKYQYEHKFAEERMERELVNAQNEMEAIKKFEVCTLDKDYSYEQALDKMIGLSSVKEQIMRIKATLDYEKQHKSDSNHNFYHMRFIGNPGTGKTSACKIMASILYDARIIKHPKYICVNGNDLMGKYVGQTAPQVDALFKAAGKGSLIFIDEAYSLVDATYGNHGGYGLEAINQLLTHLENENNGSVVIFAGYEKPMNRLFDLNPGLRSRVPITLTFPDYNETELLEILTLNLREQNHLLSNDAKDLLLQLFKDKIHLCNTTNLPFSNGRYSRRVAYDIHVQHALNYQEDSSIGTLITKKDIVYDKLLKLD